MEQVILLIAMPHALQANLEEYEKKLNLKEAERIEQLCNKTFTETRATSSTQMLHAAMGEAPRFSP